MEKVLASNYRSKQCVRWSHVELVNIFYVCFFSNASCNICTVYSPKVNLVFGSVENYTLLSRVRNKPYDVFGCWLNETHLISGNLHWIGNMTSCTVLWLNKAFQVWPSNPVLSSTIWSTFPPRLQNYWRIKVVVLIWTSRFHIQALVGSCLED